MAVIKLIDESVPVGKHKAKFLGVKPHESQYGKALRFGWQVIGGEHNGAVATRICNTKATTKNATGRILAGLAGREPSANLEVDPDGLVGREYWIEVAEVQSGGTRVESLSPVGAADSEAAEDLPDWA